MHGLIFVSFLDFTRVRLRAVAEPLRREVGDYSPDAVYSDEDFEHLVGRTAELAKAPRDGLLREFGEFAATTSFAALYPGYYDECGNTRAFLLSVEERIHELVRTALPGARPPKLHVVPLGADGVAISYTSERGLCEMLAGLVIGTARHYGEQFTVEQPSCMRLGDTACAFMVVPAER